MGLRYCRGLFISGGVVAVTYESARQEITPPFATPHAPPTRPLARLLTSADRYGDAAPFIGTRWAFATDARRFFACLQSSLNHIAFDRKSIQLCVKQLTRSQLTPLRVSTGFSRPATAELAGTERKQR